MRSSKRFGLGNRICEGLFAIKINKLQRNCEVQWDAEKCFPQLDSVDRYPQRCAQEQQSLTISHRTANEPDTSLKVAPRMTFKLRLHPAPPDVDLRTCVDHERYISGGQLWCLNTIRQHLTDMEIIFSDSAKEDALIKMAWTHETPRAFISQLARAHYRGSEWCYTTRGRKPYGADVYVMGFNRHTGVENQRSDPWIYFKYTVLSTEKSDSILIFSSHPEKKHGR